MLRKMPNYEYRENGRGKNSSDSSSGCEDDFDADDSYVNDGDEHGYENHMDALAAATAASLNLSPVLHFPPPPADYPPPALMPLQMNGDGGTATATTGRSRSRYYYYESDKSEAALCQQRRRVGSLDRDCGYTTDGNEMGSNQYRPHMATQSPHSSHSANNSFSSTSSSSNSSVVMHKQKKMPHSTSTVSRYQAPNPLDFVENGIEVFTRTENEKRYPFKHHSATTKPTKVKQKVADGRTMKPTTHCITAAEIIEQNSIRMGGSAASIAREYANAEPQVKWVRNNIAATMERFHPSPSTSKPNITDHLYHQIDESPQRSHYANGFNHRIEVAGPSRPPPPNSMRALLMTANRKAYKMSPAMRHMYTTRYGTQENIYEEITCEERLRLLSGGHSMMSLHQPHSVEEEFRRVQSRHRRILGELNLSVEAMLMPETPPNEEEPTANEATGETETSASQTHLNELLNVVGPTDELLSPVSIHASNHNNSNTCDIDSGFSGSSSSGAASYLGSLRYKNGLPVRSSTPTGHSSASSCRSSQRSSDDPGILMIPSRNSRIYEHEVHTMGKVNRFRSAEDPGPNATYRDGKVIVNGLATTNGKGSFWSRKSWRKFPGFSSNTSVNKAGLNNGKCNKLFSYEDI